MEKKYRLKNTNTEKIEQINAVNKYITNLYGRSETSYFVSNKYKFPEYKQNEEIITVILNYDKLEIKSETSLVTKNITVSQLDSLNYINCIYNLLCDIPKNSFISLIFNGVLGRSLILNLVDTILNHRSMKGLLLQPYSLNLSFGMNFQHLLVIDECLDFFNVFIIDEYVLQDSFTIRKTSDVKELNSTIKNINQCQLDDQDYVEDYQKLRMIEDVSYYACKLCEYKSKDDIIIYNHLLTNHNSEKPVANFIIKYENEHSEPISEIIKRYRFLYLNSERLKKFVIRVAYTNYNKDSESTISTSDLIDQLKFLYSNAIEVIPDEKFVLRGSELFSTLDMYKECWITDKEWNEGRLRILKEKVLFCI